MGLLVKAKSYLKKNSPEARPMLTRILSRANI